MTSTSPQPLQAADAHICQLLHPAIRRWYRLNRSQCTVLLAGLALWAVLAHHKRPYSELTGSMPGSLARTAVSSKQGQASNAPSSPAVTSGDPSSPRQSWEEMRRAQSETGSAPQRYSLGESLCNAVEATCPGFCLSVCKATACTLICLLICSLL